MQIEQPKIIKTNIPANCPHCNKQIFLGFQMMIPTLATMSTAEDIKKAKEDVKQRLNDIVFKDEKRKQDIIEWLDKETTLIDQSDVEELIKQILTEQTTTEENKNN